MGVSHPKVGRPRLLQVSEGTVRTYVKAYEMAARSTLIPKRPHWGNAQYQRNVYVMSGAERLGITLRWFPTYSPNLNLVERLRKFAKADLHGRNTQNLRRLSKPSSTV
jgi:transposase